MIDTTTSVKTLIDQFELMAMANAASTAPAAPRISGSKRTALPAAQSRSDNSPMKGIMKKTEEAVEPAEEQPSEEEAQVSKPTTPIKYKSLTIKTAESDDDDDAKTFSSYEDESDADSATTNKSTCYSAVPVSPSSFSTVSTDSMDSLLNSLDMFLPEILQAAGETSAKVSKIVKRTVHRSRRFSLSENQQTTMTSKLVPPPLYRRASLTGKPLSMTKKDAAHVATKSRRSSLYAQKNLDPVMTTMGRPRCSSLSTTMAPPPSVKSTRRFSESARGAPPVVTSPRSRRRSGSSSLPRYMDYDSSPRFAATKAKNLERRRQLEERNRKLAADKAKPKTARKPRIPEWQGRLDQVRSRLLDDASTASRRHSTSSHRYNL